MTPVATKPVTACGWSGSWRPVGPRAFPYDSDSLEEARGEVKVPAIGLSMRRDGYG